MATGAKRKRLSPKQRAEIIAAKGTASGAAVAKKFGVSLNTIYKIWKQAAEAGVAKPAAAVAAAAPKKALSANPNQNRIDFCNKWIAILKAELTRLENEGDYLKEAEAVLNKILPNQ